MLLHHHALATNSYAGRSKLSPATAPGHDETSDTVDARAVSAARDVAIQSVRLTLQHRVGVAAPTVYRFEQPRIQIGRALDNDVVISTLLRKVSRYHAETVLLGRS